MSRSTGHHHDGGRCCWNLGLSAHAILYGGTDHPWDPADLGRCLQVTNVAPKHMRGRSREWDALLDVWDEIVDMFENEKKWRDDGTAPKTYARMREVLDAVRSGGVTHA